MQCTEDYLNNEKRQNGHINIVWDYLQSYGGFGFTSNKEINKRLKEMSLRLFKRVLFDMKYTMMGNFIRHTRSYNDKISDENLEKIFHKGVINSIKKQKAFSEKMEQFNKHCFIDGNAKYIHDELITVNGIRFVLVRPIWEQANGWASMQVLPHKYEEILKITDDFNNAEAPTIRDLDLMILARDRRWEDVKKSIESFDNSIKMVNLFVTQIEAKQRKQK